MDLFTASGQLTRTVTGEGAPSPRGWFIRNRWPSAATWYWLRPVIGKPRGSSSVENNAIGVRARNAPSVVARCLAFCASLAVVASACTSQPATSYDLVIANGRVMDPESGLDAVRHVGIRGGTIAAISETPLAGTRVIDAASHVVAPGFVDLHEHGQQDESYRMMVRDGVTSAFELEVGTGDVAAWYAAREGGQIVNYGVSIGHIPARMKVLGDPGTGLLPAGIGGSGVGQRGADGGDGGDPARGTGARRGGDGVRQRLHARRADRPRSSACSASRRKAASRPTFTCAAALAGLQETIKAAAAARAPLHIVHVNSSAGDEIDQFLAAIKAARDAGPGRDDRGLSRTAPG